MNIILSEEIFEEQKLTITTCIDAIDSYRYLILQYLYTKNVGICGFLGGGKTWCMMYCILYYISKELKVTSTAMIYKRALQPVCIDSHKFFYFPTEDNLTPHRQAELSILNLMKKSKNRFLTFFWYAGL